MRAAHYPFVSELLFRAENHDINRLSMIQINQLWRIEPLEPDVVMSQLADLLDSPTLSSSNKLKLGFLAGYSWPLHHHKNTEHLLLHAKTQINSRHVEESLLLWGNLASLYLRDNQIQRAIQELTQAFHWAKGKSNNHSIAPLLSWAAMIFIRLNRPTEILHFACAGLAVSEQLQHRTFRQHCEYAKAIAMMNLGKSAESFTRLKPLEKEISSGKALLDLGNQSGAIQRMASLAFDLGDRQKALYLLEFCKEINQTGRHTIVDARLLLLRHKLAQANDDARAASDASEQLAYYQDHAPNDLDVLLDQEITKLRYCGQTPQPTQVHVPTDLDLEQSIQQLRISSSACIKPLLMPATIH